MIEITGKSVLRFAAISNARGLQNADYRKQIAARDHSLTSTIKYEQSLINLKGKACAAIKLLHN